MVNTAPMATAEAQASLGRPLIVTIAHQKGGSGKTTTACNLAIELARLSPSGSVAVIDLDPQGSATQHLSPSEDGAFGGTYELLCGTQPLSDLLRPTQAQRTLLIPAGPRLALAEIDPVLRDLSHLSLRRLLTQQPNDIDYIIIDCPPGFGGLATVAAMAADLVLIPSPPLPFAEAALGKGARFIECLRSDGRERIFLLTTMADTANPVQAATEQRLRGSWRDRIFDTAIPYDLAAERAAASGIPVVLYEPKSAMALAYKQAARELHGLLNPRLSDAETRHGEAEGIGEEPDPPRRRRWPWAALVLVTLAGVAIAAGLESQSPVLAEVLPETWLVQGRALIFDLRAFFDEMLQGN